MSDMEESIGDFSNVGLKKIKLPPAQGNGRPITLIFDHNQISKIEGLEKCQGHLQKISLASNRLVRMSGVCKLRQLRILNLPNNSIVNIEGLRELRQLTWLNLSGNSIKHIGHSLATNSKLNHFDMSDNNLGGALDGTDFRHMKTLSTLLLHGNMITSLRFASDSLPTSIAILSLAENEIGDLTEVAHLVHLQGLEQLSVMNNPAVAEEGLPRVAPPAPPYDAASVSDFDYRPYVINWCLNLKILDGAIVTKKESLKAEWLLSQGKGRHFQPSKQQHSELVDYLRRLWPPSSDDENVRDRSISKEDLKLLKILAQQQLHSLELVSSVDSGSDAAEKNNNDCSRNKNEEESRHEQDRLYSIGTPCLLAQPSGFPVFPEERGGDVSVSDAFVNLLSSPESRGAPVVTSGVSVSPRDAWPSVVSSADVSSSPSTQDSKPMEVRRPRVKSVSVAKRELNRTNLKLKLLESESHFLAPRRRSDDDNPGAINDEDDRRIECRSAPALFRGAEFDFAAQSGEGREDNTPNPSSSAATSMTKYQEYDARPMKPAHKSSFLEESSPKQTKYEEYDSRPVRSAKNLTPEYAALRRSTAPMTRRGGEKMALINGGFSFDPVPVGGGDLRRKRDSLPNKSPESSPEKGVAPRQRSSTFNGIVGAHGDRPQEDAVLISLEDDPFRGVSDSVYSEASTQSKYEAYNSRPIKPLSQDIIDSLYKASPVSSPKRIRADSKTHLGSEVRLPASSTEIAAIPASAPAVNPALPHESPPTKPVVLENPRIELLKECSIKIRPEEKDVDESLELAETSADSELLRLAKQPITEDICEDFLDGAGAGEFIATEDELEKDDGDVADDSIDGVEIRVDGSEGRADDPADLERVRAAETLQRAWRRRMGIQDPSATIRSGVFASKRKEEGDAFLKLQLERIEDHLRHERETRRAHLDLMTSVWTEMENRRVFETDILRRLDARRDADASDPVVTSEKVSPAKAGELTDHMQLLTNTCLELKNQVAMLQRALSSICQVSSVPGLEPRPYFSSKKE